MTTITIDGQSVERKPFVLGNARLVLVYLEKYATAGNDHAAWTAAPSPTVAFCSDPEGDAVITDMGPFALVEVDATNYPGWYHYVVPTSVVQNLDTDAYRGTTIYQRITAGAASEVKRMTPLLVTEPGWAD